jgi:hypothetical protein
MKQILTKAYEDGRKASAFEPRKQQDLKTNVLERTQALSSEKIEQLKIKGSMLTEERKRLAGGMERLLLGRPIEAHRQNFHMGLFYAALFLVILASEGWLLTWTLAPFGLGAEGFVIAIGLMIVGTVALEEYLRMIHAKNPTVYDRWKMWIVFFSATFFIVAIVLLSNARSALISTASSSGALESQVGVAKDFYSNTKFVYTAIALGSIAIAFVSGIVLQEAVSRIIVSGPVLSNARKTKSIENTIAAIASDISAWGALPKKAAAEYEHGLLDGPRTGENPFLSPVAMILAAIILILFIVIAARGEDKNAQSLMILVDLSGSEQGTDYLEKTEFNKNIRFVEEIIRKMEPGTHLRIVGINDRSFDKPFLILDKEIHKEKGYFSEKLAKEKLDLLNSWKQIKLEPKAKGTDIFGALIYSSLLFENEACQKKLLILSDMRNTTNLDLESPAIVDEKQIQNIEAKGLIANLRSVEVWALGVGTISETYQYWNSLKAFWTKYFEKAGAHLVSYSAERRWDGQLKSN